MDNIVLSTAAFCLWGITPEMKLKICRDLQFENIQVALSTEKMVYNLLHCLKTTLDLSSFKNVAIHAPWCSVAYGDNAKAERVLEGLKQIAELIPVKEVLFRVDCIENLDTLMASGLPICIENSDRDFGFKKFKGFAKQCELPLALNLNRALRGDEDAQTLIKDYGHRFSRVLLSGFDKENGRMPLVSTDQINLLAAIKGLEVPLVLEGLFNPGDLSAIVEERQTVLGYLSETVN